jgi:NADP-dependent 3-hydroxy acid dehydrogenase YdfG
VSRFRAVAGYSEETVRSFKDKFGPLLAGEDSLRIHYIVTRPSHVDVGDIVVGPTRQDYP